jgi:DNA polymerase/3'-5' exonuclease PolX
MISFVKIFQKMIGGQMDYKPLIIKIFRKLLAFYEVNGGTGNAFRVLAYRKSLNILERIDGPVLDINDVSELGKKSIDKIKIIMKTGTLPIYERILKDKKIEAMIMFQGIIGVGPKKAREWVDKGIYTLAGLKKVKLTENQKMGVKYYENLNKWINRKDIEEIAKIVKGKIRMSVNIVGSYRLGKETSGDIDLIITYPDGNIPQRNTGVDVAHMDVVLERLDKYIVYIISRSNNKSLLIVKFPNKHVMRMDLVCIPESQYPWYLLYFGSDVGFSRKIRDCASRKGYKLNEKGLFYKKNGKQNEKQVSVKVRNEKDIFKFLGLKYVEPRDRLDTKLKC